MMLTITDLNVTYGKKTAIRDISLEIKEGEIMALVGPNGAGKTSLIRAVSGTVRPASGTIMISGQRIEQLSAGQRARLMAVVPQARQLGGAYTVHQAVMMGRTAYMGWLGLESERDQEAVVRALEGSTLTHLAQNHIANLSGGEQQRVLLARALAQETPVLLLDEPTNHLDLRHQVEFLKLLKQLVRVKKIAVMMAMHDLNLVAGIADRVTLLVDGCIAAQGKPIEVLDEETLRTAYQVSVKTYTDTESGQRVILPRME